MSKVEFRPFSITPNKFCKWTMPDVMAYLDGISGLVVPAFRGHDRHLLIKSDATFMNGCIITDLGEGSGTTLHPTSYDETDWKADDGSINYKKNLFCLSMKTGRGLYQSQSETFPMSEFSHLFSVLFGEYKNDCIKKYMQDNKGKASDAKVERDATAKFSGTMLLKNEMTHSEFLKMLKEMSEVSDFSWSVDVSKNTGGVILPELKHAKSSSGRVRFSAVTGVNSGIQTFVKNHVISKGRVEGKDVNGVEAVYYIQKKYEVLGSLSEDGWRKRWDQKIPSFYNSTAAKTLRDTLIRNKTRFLEG